MQKLSIFFHWWKSIAFRLSEPNIFSKIRICDTCHLKKKPSVFLFMYPSFKMVFLFCSFIVGSLMFCALLLINFLLINGAFYAVFLTRLTLKKFYWLFSIYSFTFSIIFLSALLFYFSGISLQVSAFEGSLSQSSLSKIGVELSPSKMQKIYYFETSSIILNMFF